MATIAIVGAGLLGRFLALLLEPQHSITLYDKASLSDTKSTGRIAAAMVAPVAESVHASEHIVQMGLLSCQLWRPLLAHLQLETRFQQSGSIVLAHRQDLTELNHFRRCIKLPEMAETLSRSHLKSLEPDVATEFAGALWLPTEGHIDNQLLYQELEHRILASGINVKTGREVSVETNTVITEDSVRSYERVIDCRGLGAKQQLANYQKSLRGVRGEVIRVKAPEVNLTRPLRLMHPRYPIYVVPKSHHQYVIGATEIESEDTKSLTVRSGLELLSAAYSLHRGFAEAEICAFDVGLRPSLEDNAPLILVNRQRSIYINGLYRHGYLLTPCILAHILGYLKQEKLRVPDFPEANLMTAIKSLNQPILEFL